jgi:hypothetical protein
MSKEPRTASALETTVNTLPGFTGTFVPVQPDGDLGWPATIIITPRNSPRILERVERIVAELRKRYELIG